MKKIILSIFLLAPSISFAQTILSMINVVKNILGALYPVVLSIAIVYLAWQIIQYTIKGKGKDALDGIVWGIIGIAVIVGIQALANVLLDTFNISANTSL